MAETPVVLQATVAIATIWENKARATGAPFWKVVLDTGDKFTAFTRSAVARFIDGQTPVQRNEALVYNFNPPLNTVVYFEAKPTGNVMVPTPEGTPDPPVTQPAAQPPAQGQPPATAKPPYRPYGGGGGYSGGQRGKSWQPKDERPSLVTMTLAYAEHIITAIISNSDDLKIQAPEATLLWATEVIPKLGKALLDYSLAEVKALGFKLDGDK